MSLMRRTRLLATAAVSATLAVGGLTFAPSSPASAATATGTATYSCSSPGLSQLPLLGQIVANLPAPLNQLGTTGFTIPATISLANLPDVLTANVPVPAGTPLTEVIQLPTSGSGLSGVLTSVANAVNSLLGTTPLSVVSTSFSNGVATINGQLGSFDPSSGLPVPSSFTLPASLLTGNPALSALGVTCVYNAGSISYPAGSSGSGSGGTFGGVAVAKQKSTIRAHQVGKAQKVLVKVKNQTGKATGKVIAKLHGKKVGKGTLKAGKLRMKLKKLKHGLNKVKLYYQGDAISQATHKVVRVKILH